MKRPAHFIGFLILLVAPLSASANADVTPTPSFDLRTAVHTAIQHNPSIQEARKKVQEQDILVSKAWSAVFPTIYLSGTGYNKKDSVVVGNTFFDGNPYNQYSVDFHGTQTLYQYGLFAGINAPKKQMQLDQLALEVAVRNLSQQVISAFYTLLTDQNNLDHLLNVQKTEEESLAVATKFYHIGRGQLLDVLQAKTQLALLQPQLEAIRNQLRVDAAQLANLLGDPDAKEIRVKGSLDAASLPEIRSRIRLADAHLPEYETAVLNLELLNDQKAVALSPDLPSLALVGDWGRNAFTKSDILDSGATFWIVGVQLTVPIFSGLSSIYTRRDFANRNEQLSLELNNVSNNLALAQVKSQRNIEVAYDDIGSSAEAYKLAEDSLNEARRQYRMGTINYLQFLTVQQTYFQSQTTLDQAKFNYVSNLLNYYVATGLPLDQLVDELQGVSHG